MIVNIYKPVGWTSFDVVKKVRNITKEKKVGHGGTLDPFAEGVLIIGTGKDTKQLQEITNSDKSYLGVLKFGEETDTLDSEGRVVKTAPVPELSAADIKAVFNSFLGPREQTPPMYSAKKVNGVRLYKLARKNLEIHREPNKIYIYALDFITWEEGQLSFTVTCSKGTYIRVLAGEIARELGSVGHLIKLIRTSIGKFRVEDAITIPEFETAWLSTVS
ncbi:MAG: tRNA pseudouridine(55) synthase TruB [FCB group bacterium]|nr:tRNA pseudouridine(55) synthase TruB [FCB group bacterium]